MSLPPPLRRLLAYGDAIAGAVIAAAAGPAQAVGAADGCRCLHPASRRVREQDCAVPLKGNLVGASGRESENQDRAAEHGFTPAAG